MSARRIFFQLHDDMTTEGRWEVDGIRSGAEYVDLLGSESLATTPLEANVYPGHALAFCLTSRGQPVVTRSLGRVLAEFAKSDIELLPLKLVGSSSERLALNTLRSIDCLDESESDFVKWTSEDARPDLAGEFRGVRRLRLDVSRIPHGSHLFRVKGWPVSLIVSERLKDAMEQADHSGAVFVQVSGLSSEN